MDSGFLSFTLNPLYLVLFLGVSVILSFYFFKDQQIFGFRKFILILLKSLALFSVLILISNPVLSLLKYSGSGVNLILIDNSRSLSVDNKIEQRNRILNQHLLHKDNNIYFEFSDKLYRKEPPNLSQLSDSALGFQTSLSPALKTIRENYKIKFNTITIISDGNFNHGGNPVYEARLFQVPVIPVLIGDTIQKKDLIAFNVLRNEKAFTNTSVKIKAEIKSYKHNGKVTVSLLREKQVIATQYIEVNENQSFYQTEFTLSESIPAKISYRLEIKPVENEITEKNNQYDFFITYFEKRNNILLFSGGPGYDHEFIVSVIKRISEYKTKVKTLKSPEEFYEGIPERNLFTESSLIILMNFPSQKTSPSLSNFVSENIRNNKTPVLFIAGRNTDYLKLRSYETLPFEATLSSEKQSSLKVISNTENPFSDIESMLNSTPATFRNISNLILKPGSETYISDRFSGEPVVIFRNTAQITSSALLNYGLWKWQLNPSYNGSKNLEKFILKLIELSVEKEKKKRFEVYPQKDIFDYSEEAVIIAEVKDEINNPTMNASVTGKVISDAGKEYTLIFKPSEGKYFASLPKLPAGDYKIEASAELNGQFLGSDYSRFFSDTVRTEYLKTTSDILAMQELASNTNGSLVSEENFSKLTEVTDSLSSRETESLALTEKIKLRENLWMLGVIILLFASEWILRKRNNIP
ncbi:MAG: VWA domain-containing protein [Ignavibacteria bacterium]|nr:VWA domain-containing protein [Ignavibacteria bacterium]